MYNKRIRYSILFLAIGFFIYALIRFILINNSTEAIVGIQGSSSSLPAFNAPQALAAKFSDNGIGSLADWKAYEADFFMASSPYFQTGEPGKNGIANQLSYTIAGNSKNYVT